MIEDVALVFNLLYYFCKIAIDISNFLKINIIDKSNFDKFKMNSRKHSDKYDVPYTKTKKVTYLRIL